jgi:AraC family transcriptional regulator
VFVKATGYTPKKYFDALRLKCAEELLRNTSLSIAEISEKTGFSSQFHFCSAFKQTYRVPPSRYRMIGL